MRVPMIVFAPLLLVGCTQQEPQAAASAAVAGGQQLTCIDVGRVAGRRAESNRALVFELSDGRIFRNDLLETCPGAERASRFSTVAIDPIESRMCRGDLVRVYDPADLPVGGIQSAPRCRLGTFTQIERQPS